MHAHTCCVCVLSLSICQEEERWSQLQCSSYCKIDIWGKSVLLVPDTWMYQYRLILFFISIYWYWYIFTLQYRTILHTIQYLGPTFSDICTAVINLYTYVLLSFPLNPTFSPFLSSCPLFILSSSSFLYIFILLFYSFSLSFHSLSVVWYFSSEQFPYAEKVRSRVIQKCGRKYREILCLVWYLSPHNHVVQSWITILQNLPW